eukprot:Phypoly_transcript_05314.p2 GENE.Phypoly_transcript_05314~~Phypoly_transcript_05314.p2  ORF type:complete len:127 (-),score=39.56 Phypoly_transcript_05314:914-1294(-)
MVAHNGAVRKRMAHMGVPRELRSSEWRKGLTQGSVTSAQRSGARECRKGVAQGSGAQESGARERHTREWRKGAARKGVALKGAACQGVTQGSGEVHKVAAQKGGGTQESDEPGRPWSKQVAHQGMA